MQAYLLQLERLKAALKAESDTVFSQALAISQGSISGAKKREQIPHSWFFQVHELTGVSVDWLFSGVGSMYQGEASQPPEMAPPQPVIPAETLTCSRCAKLEAELEEERRERRELSAELREVNAENRKLSRENGDLKARCATLTERQKTCCPEPLPLFTKTDEDEGAPNNVIACA